MLHEGVGRSLLALEHEGAVTEIDRGLQPLERRQRAQPAIEEQRPRAPSVRPGDLVGDVAGGQISGQRDGLIHLTAADENREVLVHRFTHPLEIYPSPART